MRREVDADASSLTQRLAGTFTPTPDLYAAAARAGELNVRLFEAAQAAGEIRADASVNDLGPILEQLASLKIGDARRSRALRHRYLDLMLAGLRATGDGLRRRRRRTTSCRSDGRPASLSAMFYDDDADLALLDGKTVAIIGYGSQGHAHAQNLKDSGVSVVVGLRPDSSSVEKAKDDGFEVLDIPEAASRGDIVMILLPDEKHGEIYREQIADGIAPGNTLLFGHGFSIHYGEVDAARRRSTSR